MKTNKKSLISVLLLGLSFSLLSCGKTQAPSPSSTEHPEPAETGNHIYKDAETPFYLLQEGKSDYQILMPENPSQNLIYARDELVSLFEEATGYALGVQSDPTISFDENAQYISLGDTHFFATSGLSVDREGLGRDGSRIITKGKSIFIVGGEDIGTLYGVYDFLKREFGFEPYHPDYYTLDKGVRELKLLNYDYTDIPDIAFRSRTELTNPSTSDHDDQMFAYRARTLDSTGSQFLPIHATDETSSPVNSVHNSFYYFPKEKYLVREGENYHPKFYSDQGTQLCYTAHGDKEEWQKMIQIAAEKIELELTHYPAKEYPDYSYAPLGVNDAAVQCSCPACSEVYAAHFGSHASTILLFLKEVGKQVNEWMAKPENVEYKRDLTYSFLAYSDVLKPPFEQREDGSFDYDPALIPEEGVKVAPYVCSSNARTFVSLYDPANDENRRYLAAWGNFYPGSWLWSYGTFFLDFFCFYDMYNYYEDLYRFAKEYHYTLQFAQVHSDQRGSDTGFHAMANYVIRKKAWDFSISVNDLISDYLDAMYLEAAPEMKELFLRDRIWFAESAKVNSWGGGLGYSSPTGREEYWSEGFLNAQFTLLDAAYEKIKVHEQDPVLFQKLKRHIDMEWLFPAMVVISSWNSFLNDDELAAMKKKFKEVCLDLGIAHIREYVSINSFLEVL